MTETPARSPETGFAELVAATNYSFLRGASHPADMVAEAIALGMPGIGIADRNSVAGVVRAWAFLKELQVKQPESVANFRLVVGARLVFADGTPDIIAYPVNRIGWGRLTRLLSTGNLRAEKGDCILYLADLLEQCDELLLIATDGDEALLAQTQTGAAQVDMAGRDNVPVGRRCAAADRTRTPVGGDGGPAARDQ
jgi:error-prone DNA polymerase